MYIYIDIDMCRYTHMHNSIYGKKRNSKKKRKIKRKQVKKKKRDRRRTCTQGPEGALPHRAA